MTQTPPDKTGMLLEQYQQMMEKIGCALYRMNRQWQISYTNAAFTDLFMTGDANQRDIRTWLAPPWHSRFEAFYQTQFDKQLPETTFEFDINIDGRIQHVEQIALLAQDELFCVIKPIPQAHHQTQERLRLFNRAVEASISGVTIADAQADDHPLIYVNPAFERITGYTAAEVLGRNCRLLQRDDRDQPGLTTLRQAIKTGRECTVLVRNYRKSGERFWNELRIAPIRNAADELTHFVGISTDVTDRIEAQRALSEQHNLMRTLIDNVPDHIFAKDINMDYILANRSYADKAQAKSPDDMIGTRSGDWFGAADGKRFEAEDQQLLTTGKILRNIEERNVTESGEELWYSVLKAPLFDENGTITGLLGISRDITDRKLREEALRQREELYRLLARNLPESLVMLYDHDLRYLVAEGPLLSEDKQGFFPEILEGYTLYDILPEAYELHDAYHRALTGENTQLEFEINGRFFAIYAVPVRNEQAQIYAGMILAQDITARKQVENQLRESEELFRTMADTAPVFIWRSGLDKKCDYVNKVWLEYTGRTIEQELGDGWLEGIHPEDQLYCTEVYHAAFDARREFKMEYRLRRYDGAYRWVFDHGTPRFYADGSFAGYIGSCIDIDDRRAAESRLAESEAHNRALLEAIPDMMFVISADGVFLEFHTNEDNRPLQPPDTFLGKHILDTRIPEPLARQMLYYVKQAVITRSIQSYEYSLILDDELRYYQARKVALNDQEVLLNIRDITDLKRTQEELNQHIEDLIILRDIDGALADRLDMDYVLKLALEATIDISNADAGFIALQEEEQETLRLAHAVGNYSLDRLHEKLHSPTSIVARAIENREPELVQEVEKDPDYFVAIQQVRSKIVIPLVSRERTIGVLNLETLRTDAFTVDTLNFLRLIAGRIATALDNARLYRQTEQQLMELQQLYVQVSNLEQLKTDMIRIASHDLRNPTTGILGFLEMLTVHSDDPLTEKQESYLSKIKTAAESIQRITSGILSLERIEEIANQSQMEKADLLELINQSLQDINDMLEAKQQQLTLKLRQEPTIIEGDPLQLKEAIVNLLNNAIKYTPEGGEITVTLAAEGDSLHFSVVDTGYGIPEAQQKRLFQPFFRARTSETKAIEGTGLGLHLVKNIVQRHQGSIIFQSEYGTGSTFGFTLPLKSQPKK